MSSGRLRQQFLKQGGKRVLIEHLPKLLHACGRPPSGGGLGGADRGRFKDHLTNAAGKQMDEFNVERLQGGIEK